MGIDKIEMLTFMIFATGALLGTVLSLSTSGGLKAFRILGFANYMELTKLSNMLAALTEQSRREGLISIERDIPNITSGFIKLGLQLILDGTDPGLVDTILQNKITLFESIAKSAFTKIFFSGLSITAAALCSYTAACTLGNPHAAFYTTTAAAILLLFPCLFLFLLSLRRLNRGKMFFETAKAGLTSIQAGNNPRIARQIMESHYEDNPFFEIQKRGETNE